MKKIYQNPATTIVELNGGAICLLIGSGNSAATSGDGIDLVKEDRTSSSSSSYNVWNDDWSE